MFGPYGPSYLDSLLFNLLNLMFITTSFVSFGENFIEMDNIFVQFPLKPERISGLISTDRTKIDAFYFSKSKNVEKTARISLKERIMRTIDYIT
jgi:hypothetical protein